MERQSNIFNLKATMRGSSALPKVFKSTRHPGSASAHWVYARTFVDPLATCMLPVMIGALIAALQGFPIMAYLTVGFPLALLVAALWTAFRLATTVAEIHVGHEAVAVRTVWSCLHNRRTLDWHVVLDLRLSSTTLAVTLPYMTYELNRARWPDFEALLDALQHARDVRLHA